MHSTNDGKHFKRFESLQLALTSHSHTHTPSLWNNKPQNAFQSNSIEPPIIKITFFRSSSFRWFSHISLYFATFSFDFLARLFFRIVPNTQIPGSEPSTDETCMCLKCKHNTQPSIKERILNKQYMCQSSFRVCVCVCMVDADSASSRPNHM